jgi:hypothetical protein
MSAHVCSFCLLPFWWESGAKTKAGRPPSDCSPWCKEARVALGRVELVDVSGGTEASRRALKGRLMQLGMAVPTGAAVARQRK